MRLTNYLLPLIKENPKEAEIASHRLMLRAGMVKQQAAGIYSWLPLGLAVLKNIQAIVDDELQQAGCVPLLMPTLQPMDLWHESGRANALGAEMLKVKDRGDRELLYSPTNEEMVVDIFRASVKSYKQLPKNLYQVQWKFRDEIRPRFGVMRGREFLMKDAYSFHMDLADAEREYAKMYDAYHRIFKRLGLTTVAVKADSGAIGGSLSHEFQVLAKTGESAVYYDAKFDDICAGKLQLSGEAMRELYAAADEQHDAANCPVEPGQLREARGIEVGHIFYLGQKYTSAMGVSINDAAGTPVHPHMGCYGIGISRLVGAIIEAHHDEKGIVWPQSVTPFDVGLINLKPGDEACDALSGELYDKLKSAGKTVLYDDTSGSAGGKFASMDLIGLPFQAIIGPKGAAAGTIEFQHRKTGEKETLTLDAVLAMFA